MREYHHELGFIYILACMLTACTMRAGSLDPTNAPGPTMYTLAEIYKKIQSLDPNTQQLLSDSTVAVTAGYYSATNLTQVDLNLNAANIKAGISIFGVTGATAVVDTSSGTAMASDILAGKTAYVNGSLVIGTMALQTMTSSNNNMVAGYYASTNLTQVDTDLVAENIKTNVILFGITGTHANPSPYPSLVAKTGQTNSVQEGNDGTYQKGVAWPNPRFTIQADTNCVLDNLTGLIWARNANIAGIKSWSESITYCESLTYGGQSDWRLPNVNEMQSLTDRGQYNPSLPTGNPFVGVKNDLYWVSTFHPGLSTHAWIVSLDGGYAYVQTRTNGYYVWPVRGGQ